MRAVDVLKAGPDSRHKDLLAFFEGFDQGEAEVRAAVCGEAARMQLKKVGLMVREGREVDDREEERPICPPKKQPSLN